jgi:hypothetical protein
MLAGEFDDPEPPMRWLHCRAAMSGSSAIRR